MVCPLPLLLAEEALRGWTEEASALAPAPVGRVEGWGCGSFARFKNTQRKQVERARERGRGVGEALQPICLEPGVASC